MADKTNKILPRMSLAKDIIITGLLHCAIFFRIYTWGKQKKNEVDVVSYYAGLLEISEFRLFELSAEASDSYNTKSTRKDFIVYLTHGNIPFYVRWYLVNLKGQRKKTETISRKKEKRNLYKRLR